MTISWGNVGLRRQRSLPQNNGGLFLHQGRPPFHARLAGPTQKAFCISHLFLCCVHHAPDQLVLDSRPLINPTALVLNLALYSLYSRRSLKHAAEAGKCFSKRHPGKSPFISCKRNESGSFVCMLRGIWHTHLKEKPNHARLRSAECLFDLSSILPNIVWSV